MYNLINTTLHTALYTTVCTVLNTTVCTVLYTALYTILYTDAKNGITKFIVFLTEHSTVNLPQYPLHRESSMVYIKIHIIMYSSLYCTAFSKVYIRQWLVLLIYIKRQFCQLLKFLCSIIGTIGYAFNVQYCIQYTVCCTLKCIVQCTLYLTLYATQTP